MSVRQTVPPLEASRKLGTVDEHVTIARPVDEVFRLLTHEETEWLQPFLRLAAHKGEKAGAELRARLQSQQEAVAEGPRTIDVTIGRPSVLVEGAAIEIPLHLGSSGYRSMFTALAGRMLLSRADEQKTSLTLAGTYQPPVPVTGNLDDTLVVQHAAQTAIRDLLDKLRIAMESESSKNSLVEGSG
jgi:uncharacterized membrane protein